MAGNRKIAALAQVEQCIVGGARCARLTLDETARLMIELARAPARTEGPLYLTSVNGEVLARRRLDPGFAKLVDDADLVSADGQPLVAASRVFSRKGLPERVATTDLYPLVAHLAEQSGASFYLFGATERVNRAA